ncbi:histidinol phosphate phosphatase domain-containing protein [Methanocrinis sp.]|uniref:histidinol phosphate phosphatase domain-containing protein n=1 Tax=Methanocrinis sp. TaxID=3101522 RepID=UPI003D1229CB
MIDLHTHTVFSDGELIPSELVRRAEMKGCRALGITDHVDFTNVEFVIHQVSKIKELEAVLGMRILSGVELTHVPPAKMEKLATFARRLGADLIVVHGETPVEPVAPGTNRKALEIGADILAHPGFISPQEADLARDNHVCLELTARRGHNITNGHVARLAREAGARLVVDTDAHAPEDLIDRQRAIEIAMGAGLTLERATEIVDHHAIIDL